MTEAQADEVVEIFTLAFFDDPTWAWAFPDSEKRIEHYRRWWGLLLHSALRYDQVWLADDGGAASIWIPPGEPEFSEHDEAQVEPALREMLGSHADDVLVLLERFEQNRPQTPHYYLSLLGTHPDHRGRGKGMALLAANLAEIDQQGMPTYLESSNRANDHRYARLGYAQIGEFAAPGGGPTLACMWREPS